MKKKVWVLGSSNVDITYTVDNITGKGYTVYADSCTRATGGKGANQAVAAAHWGADVRFIGAVGDDDNGRVLLEVLKSHNIDYENVAVIGGIPSGNATISVDKSGANCITVYAGANRYVPLDFPIPFAQGDILASQLEINMDAVEFYFEQAKKAGAYTVLNPSPIQPISNKLIEFTDLIVANELEAFEISGITVDGIETAKLCAEKIIELGLSSVIITLGKMGVFVVNGKQASYIPEFPVEVVDTQGAGDAFLGTLIAKLSLGVSIEDAAAFANIVASLSVTKRGTTQVSLPSKQEVENFYQFKST